MMTYVITQYLSTLLGRSLSHLTVKHVKIKITKLKILFISAKVELKLKMSLCLSEGRQG